MARIDIDSKRYVGAQIGIYSPKGLKVGRVSHLRNREHLFLVGPDRALVEDVVEDLQAVWARRGAIASTPALSAHTAIRGTRGAEGISWAVAQSREPPLNAPTRGPRRHR